MKFFQCLQVRLKYSLVTVDTQKCAQLLLSTEQEQNAFKNYAISYLQFLFSVQL